MSLGEAFDHMISDLIRGKDLGLWKEVTTDNHGLTYLIPMKRMRKLRERGHD